MLTLFAFLLLGVGLTSMAGGDEGEELPEITDPDVDPGEGDLLDFVEGLELGVVTDDGVPIEGPITGGEGDDTITGGPNADVLNGAGGNDQIVGDLGDDTITGGLGNDTIDGGGGADVLDGNAGDDSIIGGDGNDTITGLSGADTVLGGTGDDVLDGTFEGIFVPTSVTDPGDERDPIDPTIPIFEPQGPPIGSQLLEGGEGDDELFGDKGDTLTGGEGLDRFIVDTTVDPTLGAVLITDFDPTTETLTLNIDGLEVGDPTQDGFGFDIETRNLDDSSGLEVLVQGVVVATLAGVSEADDITISIVAENSGAASPGTFTNLGDGDDTATGDLSDDTVNGGEGNDSIDGSAGRDALNGDAGSDTLDGGAGRDDLSGGEGDDLLIGGGNDETPVTTVVQERLDGGAGDDTLQTGDGYVALTGGEGTDVFEITRTEVPAGATTDQFGVRVTEITDLDVANEEVNITFVNGDASGAPVPFTLVDAPDASGVGVFIGGELYTFLTGILAADAPVVTVNSAAP